MAPFCGSPLGRTARVTVAVVSPHQGARYFVLPIDYHAAQDGRWAGSCSGDTGAPSSWLARCQQGAHGKSQQQWRCGTRRPLGEKPQDSCERPVDEITWSESRARWWPRLSQPLVASTTLRHGLDGTWAILSRPATCMPFYGGVGTPSSGATLLRSISFRGCTSSAGRFSRAHTRRRWRSCPAYAGSGPVIDEVYAAAQETGFSSELFSLISERGPEVDSPRPRAGARVLEQRGGGGGCGPPVARRYRGRSRSSSSLRFEGRHQANCGSHLQSGLEEVRLEPHCRGTTRTKG